MSEGLAQQAFQKVCEIPAARKLLSKGLARLFFPKYSATAAEYFGFLLHKLAFQKVREIPVAQKLLSKGLARLFLQKYTATTAGDFGFLLHRLGRKFTRPSDNEFFWRRVKSPHPPQVSIPPPPPYQGTMEHVSNKRRRDADDAAASGKPPRRGKRARKGSPKAVEAAAAAAAAEAARLARLGEKEAQRKAQARAQKRAAAEVVAVEAVAEAAAAEAAAAEAVAAEAARLARLAEEEAVEAEKEARRKAEEEEARRKAEEDARRKAEEDARIDHFRKVKAGDDGHIVTSSLPKWGTLDLPGGLYLPEGKLDEETLAKLRERGYRNIKHFIKAVYGRDKISGWKRRRETERQWLIAAKRSKNVRYPEFCAVYKKEWLRRNRKLLDIVEAAPTAQEAAAEAAAKAEAAAAAEAERQRKAEEAAAEAAAAAAEAERQRIEEEEARRKAEEKAAAAAAAAEAAAAQEAAATAAAEEAAQRKMMLKTLYNVPRASRNAVVHALTDEARNFLFRGEPVVSSPLAALLELLTYVGTQLGPGKPPIITLPKAYERVVDEVYPGLPEGGLPKALANFEKNGDEAFLGYLDDPHLPVYFADLDVWKSSYVHHIALSGEGWSPRTISRLAHLVLLYALVGHMRCPKSIWMWVGLASFSLKDDDLNRLFRVVERNWSSEFRLLDMNVMLRTMTRTRQTAEGTVCVLPGTPLFCRVLMNLYMNAVSAGPKPEALQRWRQCGGLELAWHLTVSNLPFLPPRLGRSVMHVGIFLNDTTGELDMSGVVLLLRNLLMVPEYFKGPSSPFAEFLAICGDLLTCRHTLARQLFCTRLRNPLDLKSEPALCKMLPRFILAFFCGETLKAGLGILLWLFLLVPVSPGTVRPGASEPSSTPYQLFVNESFPCKNFDSMLATRSGREKAREFLKNLTAREFPDTSTPLVDFMRTYLGALDAWEMELSHATTLPRATVQ